MRVIYRVQESFISSERPQNRLSKTMRRSMDYSANMFSCLARRFTFNAVYYIIGAIGVLSEFFSPLPEPTHPAG